MITTTGMARFAFIASASGLVAGCASPVSAAPTPQAVDSSMIVPMAARDSEAARIRAFGVTVPDGGVVLERPWDPPYTRRSFVVPQSWFRHQSDSVRADALDRDLPVLHALMERAYGGWGAAAHRGWNWDKWFADWHEMLRAHHGATIATADAFAPMKQYIAFQLDNHTTIPLGVRFGSGSRTSLIDGLPKGRCTEVRMTDGNSVALDWNDPAQRLRHAVRWNAALTRLDSVAYLSMPASRGLPASIRCGGGWVNATPVWPFGDVAKSTRAELAARDSVIRALSGAEHDEPNFVMLEPTIAYLRLPTFSEANGRLIEQRIEHWPKRTGNERVLIVDLRDNDGGNATLTPFAGWVDTRGVSRALNAHRHEGASCLYHALRWGYTTISTLGIRPPASPSFTQRLQTISDDVFGQSAADCPSEFKDSKSGWDYRQRVMQPPGVANGRLRLMLLVNNGCGSDCEAELIMLSSLAETVVVGSNTFGVAQFIQPGYSVLPHTRLPFRIALGTSDVYGDGRSFDGYGLDVDIVLATRADESRESILALAHYLGGA